METNENSPTSTTSSQSSNATDDSTNAQQANSALDILTLASTSYTVSEVPEQGENSLLAAGGQDALRAVPYGVARFGQSVIDLVYNVGTDLAEDTARSRILGPLYTRAVNAGIDIAPSVLDATGSDALSSLASAVRTADQYHGDLSQAELADAFTAFRPEIDSLVSRNVTGVEAIPEKYRPETLVGQFGSGAVQFVGPFAGAQRGFKAVSAFQGSARSGLPSRLYNYAGTVLAPGAATDFIAFNGDEGRLSDLLTETGFGDNYVTRWLSSDEDDGWVEGRLKNALEGSVIGIPVDFVLGGFRGLRPSREPVPAIPRNELKRMAETGEIAPEIAESQGLNWADDQSLRRDGPSRASFESQVRESLESPEEVSANLAITDAFAAVYAKRSRSALDEWYEKQAPVVQRGEDGAARGEVTFPADGRPVVTLFKQADSSTLIHEMSHVFRSQLGDIDPALLREAEEAVGVADGKWTRTDEELFASEFETYLRTGKAPREELQTVFSTFRELLTRVYQSVLGDAQIEVDPGLRDVFDIMLGRDFNRANPSNARPSTRAPNRPLQGVRDVRAAYGSQSGRAAASGQPYAELDMSASTRVADAYGKMKHNPSDPKVKESYDALSSETLDQYMAIEEQGYRLVFTRQDPYASSQAMVDDIDQNNRLFVSLTEEGSLPVDHPMAAKTGITVDTPEGESVELLVNDLFRGVHYFFGHGSEGYQFGHRGEENAWLLHSQMYSDAARPAMTTETRGQNSWVNAGQHLRRPDGSFPQRGDADWVRPGDRPFAQQKAGLLPKYAMTPPKQVKRLSKSTGTGDEIATTLQQALKAGYEGVEALTEAVGTHINYARIKTTDDVLSAIKEIEPISQQLIDGQIGRVQTMEQVAALAEELGADPRAVVSSLRGAADGQNTAVTLVAGRTLRNAAGKQVADLASQLDARAKAGEDFAELADQLTEATASLTRIDQLVGIVQKDAARGVQSGNIVTSHTLPPGVEQGILKALKSDEQIDETLKRAADKAAAEGNKNIADALSAAGRSRNPKRAAGVAAAISDAARVGQHKRMTKLINDADDPSWIDALVEFRGAAILSGPKTFAINWGVGLPSTVYHSMSRVIGAAATLDGAQLRESTRLMVNLVGASRDVLGMLVLNKAKLPTPDIRGAFKSTVRDELPHLTGESVTESRRAIPGKTGRAIRIPYTVNQLGEEFWSQINYLGYIRTQALDAADNAVWNNPEIAAKDKQAAALAFVDQYTRDAYDIEGRAARDTNGRLLHQEAVRYAKQANFMQDLEYGIGQSLLDVKKKHPALGLILPFLKAPTNLFRTAVRLTPGPNVLQENIARSQSSLSKGEKTQHIGEMVVGGALWSYSAYLAASGQITGHGPSNRAEREALTQAGWQPYSFVRTGSDGKKQYISYQRVDPWATILGLAADYTDLAGYMKTGEQDQIADGMVDAVVHNFTNKLYLRGIADFLEVMTNADKPVDGYINNFVGSFVPNFGRQIAEATDDDYRTPRTMLDAVKQRVPGWMTALGVPESATVKSLPPRRDILGRPQSPRGGWIPFVSPDNVIAKTASPLAFSEGTDDKVLEEIGRLSFGFGMPSERMSGVNIALLETPDGQNAYDRYLELSGSLQLGGQNLHDSLSSLIRSDGYKSMPDTTGNRDIDKFNPRVTAIARVISSYRRAAKGQLLQEMPELAQQIRINELSGRAGSLPSTSGPLSAFELLEN